MRYRMTLAIAGLMVVAGMVPAQERIALPPPDPGSAGLSAPPGNLPPPPDGPPQPYAPPVSTPPPPPGPYPPPPPGYYPPPPGPFGPPPPGPLGPPPPFALRDPVCNPSFWIGLDALIWWTKNPALPVPVVTTGPGSEGMNAGNLGMPGTVSLNQPLNYGVAGGFRLSAGGWFDINHTIGVDGGFFVLGRQSSGFSVVDRSGTGAFVINEPVPGVPFSTQVSAPGIETGGVNVRMNSDFWGAEINGLYNLYRGNGLTVNLLGGYRYLQLNETLNINANSTLFTTTTYFDNMGNILVTAPPGSTVAVFDQFQTRNQFNGGQLGAEAYYQRGRWSLGGKAKLALGDTHETITVNGGTTVFPTSGNPVALTGGNFATLQTGRYTADRFAIAPEGQLNVGYQLTPGLRAQLGYTFLYLSSVARPGNQIDNSYDGVAHPLVPLANSSFWAQGLTLSLQFRF